MGGRLTLLSNQISLQKLAEASDYASDRKIKHQVAHQVSVRSRKVLDVMTILLFRQGCLSLEILYLNGLVPLLVKALL